MKNGNVVRRIGQWSSGELEVNQGLLYPALYRLEEQGLLEAEWGVSEEGRRGEVLPSDAAGRARLTEEREGWRRFSGAVEAILATV